MVDDADKFLSKFHSNNTTTTTTTIQISKELKYLEYSSIVQYSYMESYSRSTANEWFPLK